VTERIDIQDHVGRKYLRLIRSSNGLPIEGDCGSYPGLWVDVYDVIEAFKVDCPAVQHALKKLLCAGLRGKGDALDDLHDVLAAVSRAIDLEESRLYAELEEDVLDGPQPEREQVRAGGVCATLPLVDPEPEGAPH
jgi:hypothetical protein